MKVASYVAGLQLLVNCPAAAAPTSCPIFFLNSCEKSCLPQLPSQHSSQFCIPTNVTNQINNIMGLFVNGLFALFSLTELSTEVRERLLIISSFARIL